MNKKRTFGTLRDSGKAAMAKYCAADVGATLALQSAFAAEAAEWGQRERNRRSMSLAVLAGLVIGFAGVALETLCKF